MYENAEGITTLAVLVEYPYHSQNKNAPIATGRTSCSNNDAHSGEITALRIYNQIGRIYAIVCKGKSWAQAKIHLERAVCGIGIQPLHTEFDASNARTTYAGGPMNINLICCVVFTLLLSSSNARQSAERVKTLIAIEFRANDVLTAVGSLEYTGETLEIVGFSQGVTGIGIVPIPQIYRVTDKTVTSEGIHHIKARNQNCVIASGTIDFRDRVEPKITLVTQGGTVIRKITKEGLRWKRKYIPTMVLGQECWMHQRHDGFPDGVLVPQNATNSTWPAPNKRQPGARTSG